MKFIVVMASIFFFSVTVDIGPVSADIEDNQITVENYGTTEAKGYRTRRRVLFSSRTRDYRGSNAGGVIIECASGSSCKGNNITVRNSGYAYSGRGGTVAGVTIRE